MSGKPERKQVPINFNMEDKRESELYNWFADGTSSVSGAMKQALFVYREQKLEQEKVAKLYELSKTQDVQAPVQTSSPAPKKKKRKLGALPGVD